VAPAGAPVDASPAGAASSEATVLRVVQSMGAVIGPTALITALLFYFGWAKADAFARYFGLDVSLFGLSTQDYLLQSIRAVFVPLGVVLIAGLGLLSAHRTVVHLLERDPSRALWRRVAGALAAAGTVSFVFGLATYAERFPSDAQLVVTPMSLMLGVGLLGYAVLVARRTRRAQHRHASAPPGPSGGPGLSLILVSMLLAVGLVWAVSAYAEVKGREEGEHVHDQLEFQPGVVVYSARRLHIAGPGVAEAELAEAESAYAFRYDGLKLLFHSRGRYFLVPASWSLTSGTTIVLQDNDSLRLEFVRPPD
jgi:hypothetical protein